MIDQNIIQLLGGSRDFYEWTSLEQVPTMTDGGGADTGGPNALPHGKFIWKPGTPPDNPATLTFTPIKRPPGKPWDNLYAYNTITRRPPSSNCFGFELQFAIGALDLKGNAREFEIELCESGYTYNMAWQYKWSNVEGPPAWRLFDQIAEKWVPFPAIPPPSPRPNAFVSMQAFFAVDRSVGITTHDSIVVDGKTYSVNISHPRKLKWNSTSNYLHNAVQIDSMGDGVPCGVQIRDWNVRSL